MGTRLQEGVVFAGYTSWEVSQGGKWNAAREDDLSGSACRGQFREGGRKCGHAVSGGQQFCLSCSLDQEVVPAGLEP